MKSPARGSLGTPVKSAFVVRGGDGRGTGMQEHGTRGSNGNSVRTAVKNAKGIRERAAAKQPPGAAFDTRLLLGALTALKKGDFSVRLPIEWEGLDGKIAETFNDVVELNQKITRE